jgi:hypothetical protein
MKVNAFSLLFELLYEKRQIEQIRSPGFVLNDEAGFGDRAPGEDIKRSPRKMRGLPK